MLLDLDDIDRLWVNAPGPRIDKAELQKRRSNLLEVSPQSLCQTASSKHSSMMTHLGHPYTRSDRQASVGRPFRDRN